MQRFLLAAFALLTVSCSSKLGLRRETAGHASAGPKTYRIWREVVYTPSDWPKALRADIYQPKGEGPWPGVLMIHGGGWTKSDRRSDMEAISRYLAKRGYVVMNATYRLAPEYVYPAQVDDLQEAMRWFKAHGADFKLQAGPMAVFGYSAGGHLAALLGSMDSSNADIKAVVAGGAPLDLRKFPGPGMIANFLGGEMAGNPATYVAASPITHVSKGDPPVFLYHGSADRLVPPDHSSDYQKALTVHGVPNELFWIRGRGHVTTFLTDGAAIRAATRFLDEQFKGVR